MIYNTLTQLTRAGLGLGYEWDPKTTTPWAELYELASAQGIAPIVWDGIERAESDGKLRISEIDKSTKLRWALSVETLTKRYHKQRRVLTKLARFYAERGIRLMVLKGYGLSLCYPTPEHRSCTDVDIWLFGEQERADRALRRELNIAIDEDKHHHTVFHIEGVMFENHYDFLNVESHLSNREIERELKELAMQAESIDVEGVTIYTPNANCHALFLIRHAAAHFAAVEIVLRHILDWAMFIKHNHSAIDWVWLRRICRQQNMERFLDVMNMLAAQLCDIELSLMPDTTRNTALEERVLNDILHPEFSEKQPSKGLVRILAYKLRRWWRNRWKHRLVYREGLTMTFLTQLRSHLLKPKTFKQ